jgi:hypothetical protein
MFVIKIIPSDKGDPPSRLAEWSCTSADGPLAGLKLIGFIWKRRGGSGLASRSRRGSTWSAGSGAYALLRRCGRSRAGTGARADPRRL